MKPRPSPARRALHVGPLLLALAACPPPAPAPAPAACPRVYLGEPGIVAPPGLDWPAGGAPEGLDPALAEALVGRLGCPLRLVRADDEGPPTELRFSLLEAGRADLALFQVSVTPERAARVGLSAPYAVDGVGLVVATDGPAQARADLAGARVVASAGSTAAAWVAEVLPEATLLADARVSAAMKDCFDAGTCDALAGDHASLAWGAARDPRVRLLPDGPYTREPWAVAVRPDDPALRGAVDRALAGLEADGTLPALRRTWGVAAP